MLGMSVRCVSQRSIVGGYIEEVSCSPVEHLPGNLGDWASDKGTVLGNNISVYY